MKRINKTWILIIFLIILTLLLLAISFYAENFSSREEENTPTITIEKEKEVAFTVLSFSGEPRISTVSGRYELDLEIDTDKNEVELAQLELSYDPNSLTIYDITPGSLMPDAYIIQKNIDQENGRISFWLGVDPTQRWVQGKGTLATISFTKIGTGSAEVNFSPKTSVTENGIEDSVLKETIPGFIDILPSPSPFPTRATIPTPSEQTQ